MNGSKIQLIQGMTEDLELKQRELDRIKAMLSNTERLSVEEYQF